MLDRDDPAFRARPRCARDRARGDWPLRAVETAILVADLQASETAPETLAETPHYRAGLDRALPALACLVDGARGLGREIVYTMIEALTADGRDRSLDHKLSAILVPKGHPHARRLSEARQQPDDIVLPKTSSGVFHSTNAAYVLRNLGIRNMVVAGLPTDQCVDMAVRDGADLGFYMICAADACASRTEARHDASAWARAAFGDGFVDAYLALKRHEVGTVASLSPAEACARYAEVY